MKKELDILFATNNDNQIENHNEPENSSELRHFIIIGTSTGLGLALVNEFIKKGFYVTGIDGIKLEDIPNNQILINSDYYNHVELDITSLKSEKILSNICAELWDEPIGIIFNASINQSDIKEEGNIDFTAISHINRTSINGLTNTLKAFEKHLLTYGGVFITISPLEALNPTFTSFKGAYSASFAYINMFLRTLKMAWDKKVKVVNVNTSRMQESASSSISGFFIPTYKITAKKIIKKLTRKNIPHEMTPNFLIYFIHKYFYRILTDNAYRNLYKIYLETSSLFTLEVFDKLKK